MIAHSNSPFDIFWFCEHHLWPRMVDAWWWGTVINSCIFYPLFVEQRILIVLCCYWILLLKFAFPFLTFLTFFFHCFDFPKWSQVINALVAHEFRILYEVCFISYLDSFGLVEMVGSGWRSFYLVLFRGSEKVFSSWVACSSRAWRN